MEILNGKLAAAFLTIEKLEAKLTAFAATASACGADTEMVARLAALVPCFQAQKTACSHSSRLLVTPDTQVLANAAKHNFRDDFRGMTPRRARAEQRNRDHGLLLPPPPPPPDLPALRNAILYSELETFRGNLYGERVEEMKHDIDVVADCGDVACFGTQIQPVGQMSDGLVTGVYPTDGQTCGGYYDDYDDGATVDILLEALVPNCVSHPGPLAVMEEQLHNVDIELTSAPVMTNAATSGSTLGIDTYGVVSMKKYSFKRSKMWESYGHSWKQDVKDGEVEIIFTPAITADDAKQLVVTFAKQEVKVELHGNILLEGSLFGPIHHDEVVGSHLMAFCMLLFS